MFAILVASRVEIPTLIILYTFASTVKLVSFCVICQVHCVSPLARLSDVTLEVAGSGQGAQGDREMRRECELAHLNPALIVA